MDFHAELPSFTITRSFFSQKCIVLAKWLNGDTVTIGGFESRDIAEYWLESEAVNWLRHHRLLAKAA